MERRDPYKLYHKLSRRQFEALAPAFPWNTYFDGLGLPGLSELNVTEPVFFRRVGSLVKTRRLDEWKPYLRVSAGGDGRALSLVAFRAGAL